MVFKKVLLEGFPTKIGKIETTVFSKKKKCK